jgi:hypothetical protein
MPVFSKPNDIYKDISNKYKRPREAAVISNPIEIDGRKYREIVYNKTFLGKVTDKTQGFTYITEDGSVVTDIRRQKQLSEIAFYSRLIFDDAYSGNIKSAITPETKIAREEEENKIVIEGLEVLKDEGVSGIVIIIDILSKLPGIKRENNIALVDFVNKLEKYNTEGIILNKALIDELLPYYRSALTKNFERIKLVNKGKKYYDDINSQISKRKKQLKTRFVDRQGKQILNMIENKISYLKKILEVYDAIANMSEAEYIKYLNKTDETNINKNLEMVRI